MTKGKTKTERMAVMLSERTICYLADLVEAGTHGTDAVDVMRTLIEQGVRNAIREGFIKKR